MVRFALSSLFIAVTAGFSGGAARQNQVPEGPEKVRLLLSRYHGAIRQAELEMKLKRIRAQTRCLTALSAALDEANAEGDAAYARAVRRAIATFDGIVPTDDEGPEEAACKRVCGRYHAFHEHWFGELRLAPDGRFHDGNEWRGRWILRGRELFLMWKRYPADLLLDQGDGYRFSSPTCRFVLVRM